MTVATVEDSIPTTLPAKIEYARALATSNLLPPQYRGKPENLLYAMEYAAMLDVPPMTAVTGIHVINGQPSGSASLIASLVRRAGHKLRTERIQGGARTTIIRKDDPDYPHVVEFTMEDAQRAGLMGNDNWKKRPAVMCEWRSITACARLACSEVLFGIAYTPDELEEVPARDGAYEVTSVPKRVTAAEILGGQPSASSSTSGGSASPATTSGTGTARASRQAAASGATADATADTASDASASGAPQSETPQLPVEDPPQGYDDGKWLDGAK